MKFQVLGPMAVTVGGRPIRISSSRQRTVLGMLLLERRQVVPVHRLIDALWDDDPPATARAQVQICVSGLRRVLHEPGQADPIRTTPHGYQLSVDEESVDLDTFHRLVADAETEAAAQRLDLAVERLRGALGLWRGEAFADVTSRLVAAAASRFAELRLSAAERCIELELALGRHEEASHRLAALIEEYPLRETLRHQQMLALYRSGLRVEALEVFRTTRQLLVTELGLEPGPELRSLEHAILVGDRALDPPASRPLPAVAGPVPRQLPADIPDFTGRAGLVADLTAVLAPAAGRDATERPGATVPGARIVVITGRAGVGKTALAVRVAHEVAGAFPDGQLFVSLSGDGTQPIGPGQVLERFLRAFGRDGTAIPDTLDERSETLRSLLADRRVLIVLDSAAGEGQVRPLLPGTDGAAVVVTSRLRLTGLAGAVHRDVDVLDEADSVRLLATQSGRVLHRTELDAARRLIVLCGGLPLALRIAAARLAGRPHWSAADLVDRLRDEHHRLDELRHGDLGVRSSISLTFDSLAPQVRHLFRLLGIVQATDFPPWMVAPLLDVASPADGAELLELLVDARMVDAAVDGGGPRYRIHDLLLVFAREHLAAEVPAAERTAALHRLLGCLLHLAEQAHRRIYGGDYTRLRGSATRWRLDPATVDALLTDPRGWFARERGTIVAAVRQAAAAGLHEHAWELAMSAVALFEQGSYVDDWRETHSLALAAACRHGNRRGEAAMRYSLGALAVAEQRSVDAVTLLDAAHEIFQELALAHGTGLVLRHLAFIDRLHGRYDAAVAKYERALPLLRAAGDRIAEAHVLHGLGRAQLDRRQFPAAQRLLAQALAIALETGNRRVAAQTTHALGEVCLELGDLDGAEHRYRSVLGTARTVGDPIGEAYALEGLGRVALGRRRPGDAASVLSAGLTVAQATNDQMIRARLTLALGEAHAAGRRPEIAVSLFTDALGRFRQLGAQLWEARSIQTARRLANGGGPGS